MTDHTHAKKKARPHTIYKNSDGKRVPGCTTITGVMDKPALVAWANKIGLEGIKVREYVDELALIGTLAHYMIECHCKGVEPELDYSPSQIDLAENSFIKWMEWQKQTGFVPLNNELHLVSDKHSFGGTIDIIGTIGGKRVLVDIKTSKGIYGEHKTQVAGGYKLLCDEHREYNVDQVIITRVGRNEDEGFEQVNISQAECELHQRRFLICRELYEINKECNRKR